MTTCEFAKNYNFDFNDDNFDDYVEIIVSNCKSKIDAMIYAKQFFFNNVTTNCEFDFDDIYELQTDDILIGLSYSLCDDVNNEYDIVMS